MNNKLRYRLNEELKKSDINSEIDKFLNSNKLKDKITQVTKDRIRNEKMLEDKIVEISSNVLTQLFKTFWVKRNFWKNQLSNKAN